MRRLLFPLVALVIALALAACQRSSPTVEAESTSDSVQWNAFSGPDVVTGPAGLFHLDIAGDQTVALTPLRGTTATVGQHFNVDLTTAFTQTFCSDCVKVLGITREGDNLRLDLQVRHPFDLAEDSVAPSAKNRRDLWISTVKGILLLDGSGKYFNDTVQADSTHLVNPDGYTNLFTPPVGSAATVFPYIVFGATDTNSSAGNYDDASGWRDHTDDPSGYGILANGQTGDASYLLAIKPGETLAVDLALTAAFTVSVPNRATRLAPEHFMPAGAAPEPWRVTVRADGDLDSFNDQSAVNLHIEVLDWQQDPALSVDAGYPNLANRRGLAVTSRIDHVDFSLPSITGIESTPVDLSTTGGTGWASDPWQVNVTLTNNAAAGPGLYTGLLRVVDERDPRSTAAPFGSTTFVGPDLATPYTPPSEFATYAIFTVSVIGGEGCQEVFPIGSGEAERYAKSVPSYVVARSQQEYDDAVALLTATPPAPSVDWVYQSVVIATTGEFTAAQGMHTVAVKSWCTDADGNAVITILRADPLTQCPVLPIPTTPYVVATVESRNPNYAFVEEQVDSCGGYCAELPIDIAGSGDAAATFTGGLVAQYVTNPTDYDALMTTLLGATPPPPIDFATDAAYVLCSGYYAFDFDARSLTVTRLCNELVTGNYQLTWEHSEYVTCRVRGIIPTAPWTVVRVPQTTGTGLNTAYLTDLCGPPFP
ncbi:MAG: hypothetical protein ABI743_08315, partial [bacterium]